MEERKGSSTKGWETASSKQELFWTAMRSKHCLWNILFHLLVQKSMVKWRYSTKEKVHIQWVKTHDIHKCTDMAAGWRQSPFSQGSFMQICRRSNTAWSVTADFAGDPPDVNSKISPVLVLLSEAFQPFKTLESGPSPVHLYIPVQRKRSCRVPDSGSVFALFLYWESHSGGEFDTRFNI